MANLVAIEERGQLAQNLKIQLEDYLETGQNSEDLENSLDQMQLPHLFRKSRVPSGIQSNLACFACRSVVAVFNGAVRAGVSKEKLSNLAINVCVWLKIELEHVCRGAVNLNIDTILYIINNRPSLTAERMCAVLMSEYGCEDTNPNEWSIDVPPRYNTTTRFRPQTKFFQHVFRRRVFNILHITDIHYDPEYTPGASANCEEPICCQPGSTPKNPGVGSAGKWGDYTDCDIPLNVLLDSLRHIRARHKNLDYVYFTGDIVSHKIWATSIERNKRAISEILFWMRLHFYDVPVFPILGNHEPHPLDLFAPEGTIEPWLSTRWIFDFVADEWQFWLPAKTRNTILKGGYYTISPEPGFRIVALNSNVCYTLNFWLLYDDVDPFQQLQWLIATLQEAERNGETVHILSHVPPGSDRCLINWARVYNKIVSRFSHIIAAQFTGHTHLDDTVIYFDQSNPSKPINVEFNGGSLTTYSNLNPNYKVFQVDAETFQLVDFESWTYNVTQANLSPDGVSPKWHKLYNFKSAYGLRNLAPQELAILTQRMARSPELCDKYFRYKYRGADTKLKEGCDRDCQIKNLCDMVTTNIENTLHCQMLTQMYNAARPL